MCAWCTMSEDVSTDCRRPFFSRFWLFVSPSMDKGGMRDFRRQLLAELEGDVLEIGAGNGLNFPWYPEAVTRVLAVEPEPRLRDRATTAAAGAPIPVRVTAGTAQHLPCADESVDAVVCSLVLCSVADQDVALHEAHRVLRPGGQLRFLEHVRADTRGLRRVQNALDATVWPRFGGGCHMSRDTAASIEGAGFRIERIERFRFPQRGFSPTSPHIIGVAVRD